MRERAPAAVLELNNIEPFYTNDFRRSIKHS